MCFVLIWEQSATFTLHVVKWLGFLTEVECLQRGTHWVFILDRMRFVFKGLNIYYI
jgi:hypothetical protein